MHRPNAKIWYKCDNWHKCDNRRNIVKFLHETSIEFERQWRIVKGQSLGKGVVASEERWDGGQSQ